MDQGEIKFCSTHIPPNLNECSTKDQTYLHHTVKLPGNKKTHY